MSTIAAPGPLAVRLCNYIGDVVLGLPALQLLHDHDVALQLYGKGWARVLLSAYPWAVTVRERSWSARVAQLRALRADCGARQAARRVDALVMPNSLSSAVELRLAGWRPAGVGNEGRSIFLSQVLPASTAAHKLEGFWSLASGLLGVTHAPPRSIGLRLTAAAQERADALTREHGLHDGFLMVAPLAAGDVDGQDKRWPHFAALSALLERVAVPIVACPGPGEADATREALPRALLLDDVALDTYAALLARCRLMIANDTGPAHLAAAVGAPVLSVLGPTLPEVWGPWGPTVRVVRRWPGWPGADEVMSACEHMLAADAPTPR